MVSLCPFCWGVGCSAGRASPPSLCFSSAGVAARWGGSPPAPPRRGLWWGFPLGRPVARFRSFLAPFWGVLFRGWGGFFRVWGGFLRGWAVLGVSFFFVALLCPLVWCRGCFLSCFGCAACALVRVVCRFRLVCAGRAAGSRCAWGFALGARRGCVSPLCRLALRSFWLPVVGGLGGGLRLRRFARRVRAFGRCRRA